MSTVDSTVNQTQVEKKLNIRWRLVILSAVLSEVAVILLLAMIIMTYSLAIAPGRTNSEYDEFAQLAGYYVAPAAGALSTFLVVLWMGRRLKASFLANGLLTGIVSVLLTAGFLVTARPEHRLMYLIAFALRIVAGGLGGIAVQKSVR